MTIIQGRQRGRGRLYFTSSCSPLLLSLLFFSFSFSNTPTAVHRVSLAALDYGYGAYHHRVARGAQEGQILCGGIMTRGDDGGARRMQLRRRWMKMWRDGIRAVKTEGRNTKLRVKEQDIKRGKEEEREGEKRERKRQKRIKREVVDQLNGCL